WQTLEALSMGLCEGDASSLCYKCRNGKDERRVGVPYILIHGSLDSYRSRSDFLLPNESLVLSTSSAEQDVRVFENVLARSKFTADQRPLEDRILRILRMLVSAKSVSAIDGLGTVLVDRIALEESPASTAGQTTLWNTYYSGEAQTLLRAVD